MLVLRMNETCTIRMVAENFDVFAGNQCCNVEMKKKKHRKRLISGLLFMFCECVRLIKNDEAKAEVEENASSKAGKNSTFRMLIRIIEVFQYEIFI